MAAEKVRSEGIISWITQDPLHPGPRQFCHAHAPEAFSSTDILKGSKAGMAKDTDAP